MPPKRGTKRKAPGSSGDDLLTNGHAELLPPDRATWPGWVEMESEPAFFNVMLKEMGVSGVKVQEVYGVDEEMLAILPQPVHALIFLFRYRDIDESGSAKGTDCPDHVWFANQIPDFACATVALLNIVNNIEGLQTGTELQDFKTYTQAMDPLGRGDAIDSFDFVKHIHNSFAQESDLLIADMHFKQKAAKAKKRVALQKARETRDAKKEVKTSLKEESSNAKAAPTRLSKRTPKKTTNTNGSKSPSSSPLSDPPDSDPDFSSTPSKGNVPAKKPSQPQRRSERRPAPRKDTSFADSAIATAEIENEEGFHFIAYMPIAGNVWKLDGLDSFPQDIGSFHAESGGDWMSVAQLALQTRMAMYEGADIEFNLMAVVHDGIVREREELKSNVKDLQKIEQRLDGVFEDWRELDGGEKPGNLVTGLSLEYDISQAEIDDLLSADAVKDNDGQEDLMQLVTMRKEIISRQAPLRAAIRDALESSKGDEEKARHRRHDYGKSIRLWLGALAEEELLGELLESS